MSGFEVMGIFFTVLLSIGVAFVIMWVIGSVWRHGDEIGSLEVKVRLIEDRYRDNIARNIDKEIQKHSKKGKTK